jgi:adenylate kinase family enzyme
MNPPSSENAAMVIHVDGPSGVGKTWLVAELAKHGRPAIDMDDRADALAMQQLRQLTPHNRDRIYQRIGTQLRRTPVPPDAIVVGRTYDGPAETKVWLTAPPARIQRQYHSRVLQQLHTHRRMLQRYAARPEQLEWVLFHRVTMREGFPRMQVNVEPPDGCRVLTPQAALRWLLRATKTPEAPR